MELRELEVGSVFKYAGYEFIKLADEKESCYCLLNDKLSDNMLFGKTNDWAKSPIRKRLNSFDRYGLNILLPRISKEDLVRVSLNYSAYKIPNGRTIDYITLLSYEEYLVYKFPFFGVDCWLRTGDINSPYYSNFLASSGGDYNAFTAATLAVRPALHLKSFIEVD